MENDMEKEPLLDSNLGKIENAYGLYLILDDCGFDELHKSDAEHKVDIVIKYNDVAKEFSLQEFVTLLGFTDATER